MKKLCTILVGIVLISASGCALESWNKNPLRNLNQQQSDWFERTSEGWRFE